MRLLLVVEIRWAFAGGPQDVLEIILQLVRKCAAQPAYLLLAQLIDTIAIVPRDMEAVDHERGFGQDLLHRTDVALPHIGADGLDAATVLLWHGLEPGHDDSFEPIGQDGQDVQAIGGGLGGEHSDEIAMALFEGDLVDAEHGGWFERRPIDRGGNPAVEDTEQGIVADIFFRDDIGHGAVDQLNDQVALVGLGMQGVGVVPIELLGGGRVVIAVGTAKAFGMSRTGEHGFFRSFGDRQVKFSSAHFW